MRGRVTVSPVSRLKKCLMNKIECLRCDNSFFTAARDVQVPCPYCGFVANSFFSNRRLLEREIIQKGCDILKGEVRIPVKTIDVSKTGVGIKMNGYLPFEEDETVRVQINDLDITREARVVWTRRFYGISRAGLRFS